MSNLYVVDATGGDPRALTGFTTGAVGGAFWSSDGTRLFFPRGGDLWQIGVSGGPPAAVWTTPAAEGNIVLSPGGRQVAFVRGGTELWTRSLADGRETRLAEDAASIGNITWAPDAAHLAFAAGASSIRHDQTPDYSGSKIIYTITERTPGQAFVVAATGGKPVAIGTRGGGGVRWLDSRRVVFDCQSADFKRRTSYVADSRVASRSCCKKTSRKSSGA